MALAQKVIFFMTLWATACRYLVPLAAMALPLAPTALHATVPDDGASLRQTGEPPRKHSILITYGDDACPAPIGDEIIVCAQQPESERYRVPKELREEIRQDDTPMGQSWGSAVEGYDDIARMTRPDSCSAVGSYGATGCMAAALRQWHTERRQNP